MFSSSPVFRMSVCTLDSLVHFRLFSSLLGRNTWTPTNASTSSSNSSRRSGAMSDGKRFLRLLGRCFIASGYQQLPAIHSQPEAAEQCCLVLSARQALYAVLEKCFLCWKHTKKWQTKGRPWSQCGADWGHFSWRSFWSGFAQTMGMESLWRCQSNDLVPSMLLSSYPFQWCTAPIEKKRQFFKLHPLLYGPLSISMELYSPSSK